MEQALPMVKNLERFIKKHGDDAFISRTISKLVDYKIQKYMKEVKGLEKELKKFEHAYHKDSSVFFKEFNEGVLGDDIDFIEWYSLCKMRDNILKMKSELESAE